MRCTAPECAVVASFGRAGGRPRFCGAHRGPGMVNVVARRCRGAGCARVPHYAEPGAARPAFCRQHAEPGMVNVVTRLCAEPACGKRPTYAEPGGRARFCREHAGDGMVDAGTRRPCEAADCRRQPCFAEPGAGRARFCSAHAAAGMVDVVNRRCEADGCGRYPVFGESGTSQRRLCRQHAAPGMVRVCRRACRSAGCGVCPSFGLPGHPASACRQHAQPGMIRGPRRRCTAGGGGAGGGCSGWSTHGRLRPERCEAHAAPGDWNLVERPCAGCSLPMLLSADGLCEFCAPTDHNRRRRLARQDAVRLVLRERMPDRPPTSVDQPIPDLLACGGRERPDFFWDLGDASLILEVDEHQHAGRPCECEQVRMVNVTQALGGRVQWVRFNPDAYEPAPGGRPLPLAGRYRVLVQTLRALLDGPRDGWPALLAVRHLYFDGFARGDEARAVQLAPEAPLPGPAPQVGSAPNPRFRCA